MLQEDENTSGCAVIGKQSTSIYSSAKVYIKKKKKSAEVCGKNIKEVEVHFPHSQKETEGINFCTQQLFWRSSVLPRHYTQNRVFYYILQYFYVYELLIVYTVCLICRSTTCESLSGLFKDIRPSSPAHGVRTGWGIGAYDQLDAPTCSVLMFPDLNMNTNKWINANKNRKDVVLYYIESKLVTDRTCIMLKGNHKPH